jgi:DNA-binding response OmpR family regulator
VSSGEEAVRTALAERPDVVLMDVRLNGAMDGVEAAQEIHAKLGVPIFFLTAQCDAQTTARMRQVDSAVILNKPLRMTAFCAAMASSPR